MNIDISYLEIETGKSPFLEWEKKLDLSTRAVVRARINRVRLGNFGDFHSIKGAPGLYEFRIHVGPGYRIYFGKIKEEVVIILCGGDKRLSMNSGFVDFRDYFDLFSIQNWGAIYWWAILPPNFESKIGQKNPKIDRS